MAARFHRPLKIRAFDANEIWSRRCEISRQLQYLHIKVALLSETHRKQHERFFIPDYQFYRPDYFPGINGGTAITVRKYIPRNHVDLPPLVSIETTGVCIQIGNSRMLLVAVCKSPGHARCNRDVTELLSFRQKSLLAGDLNAKHTYWNSVISKSSGAKLLNLLQFTAPQCPTHYSPTADGNVLDIVVHKNVRLSEIIVSDW
jgi:hypothetical protein